MYAVFRSITVFLAGLVLAGSAAVLDAAPAAAAGLPGGRRDATRLSHSAGLGPRAAIAVFGTARTLRNDDLRDVYGWVPGIGLGVSRRISRDGWLWFGVAYEHSRGDIYGDPTFEAPNSAALTLVPITLGLRARTSNDGPVRLVMGFEGVVSWMRESAEGRDYFGGEHIYEDTGLGIRFFLGPEWMPGNGGWASELELGLEEIADVHATGRHETDVSALTLRLVFSRLY